MFNAIQDNFIYEKEYKVSPESMVVDKLAFSLNAYMETAEWVRSALLYCKCNKCKTICFYILF